MINILARGIASFIKSNKLSFTDFIQDFFENLNLKEILDSCGGSKLKGTPGVEILHYLVSLSFRGIESYNHDTKENPEAPRAHTIRRFLKNENIDWNKLTATLSFEIFSFLKAKGIISGEVYFIVDDTDYPRPNTKHADEIARQFNHTNGTYYVGYRFLMLSVQCGELILPVCGAFIGTANESKRLYQAPLKEEGTPSAKRQKLARSKALEVLFSLIDTAEQAGYRVKTLLMDTWFTWPQVLYDLKQRGITVVGALKNAKTKYLYEGRWLRMGEIFQELCPKGGLPDYNGIFASTIVEVHSALELFKVKLIYAKNVNQNREYFCLISTDLSLDGPAVVRAYRYRFTIEHLFKLMKNPYFSFKKGDQSLSLDSISAYGAIVEIRVMIVVLQKLLEGNKGLSFIGQAFKTKDEVVAAAEANKVLNTVLGAAAHMSKILGISEREARAILVEYLLKDPHFIDLASRVSRSNYESIFSKEKQK